MKTFGQVIRERREELGVAQKDLAATIGITPQYMSDIEQGKRTPTDEVFLYQIAEALNYNRPTIYMLAGRLPQEMHEYILEHPDAAWWIFDIFCNVYLRNKAE